MTRRQRGRRHRRRRAHQHRTRWHPPKLWRKDTEVDLEQDLKRAMRMMLGDYDRQDPWTHTITTPKTRIR